MTLTPLLAAPPAIQIHVSAALLAIALGPLALFRRSRDGLHMTAGAAWVASMATLAISGFFINGLAVIGPFGPIHLLSILVLGGLVDAIRHLIAGRGREHGRAMKSLYFQALGIGGLFTVLPGRTMSRVLFGEATWLGWVVIATGLTLVMLTWWRSGKIGLHIRRPSR
ncbi:DUF2306 domain-containing protein [Pelagovum pacificum]|uniref:DUF2306 domain-containing protein n=1 Tax=Pelagovum pacificum TaxID=2588711 RepID=A0A5C5G8T1_9RHOB|nr:DUF2306 domain-containing protein [Pelagovum pacificum]QQA42047.1 DUF2306 domain-containing protein [Pelagovum pacificum]TNY31136.1 DUF2306 domain-containing protein [Pelagovum pacificum]